MKLLDWTQLYSNYADLAVRQGELFRVFTVEGRAPERHTARPYREGAQAVC
jgi:hypothetical protein